MAAISAEPAAAMKGEIASTMSVRRQDAVKAMMRPATPLATLCTVMPTVSDSMERSSTASADRRAVTLPTPFSGRSCHATSCRSALAYAAARIRRRLRSAVVHMKYACPSCSSASPTPMAIKMPRYSSDRECMVSLSAVKNVAMNLDRMMEKAGMKAPLPHAHSTPRTKNGQSGRT